MDRKLEQLQNFLESNDLGEYFDAITNQLKMKSVAKLKFISEDDLVQIGMSRPQIKMLFDCYKKEQSAFGKLKRMFVPARAKSKANASFANAAATTNESTTSMAIGPSPNSNSNSNSSSNGNGNGNGISNSTSNSSSSSNAVQSSQQNSSVSTNNYVMPAAAVSSSLPVAAVSPTVANGNQNQPNPNPKADRNNNNSSNNNSSSNNANSGETIGLAARTFRRNELATQSVRPNVTNANGSTQPVVSTPTSLRSITSFSSNSQSDSISPSSTLASRFRQGLSTLPSKPTRSPLIESVGARTPTLLHSQIAKRSPSIPTSASTPTSPSTSASITSASTTTATSTTTAATTTATQQHVATEVEIEARMAAGSRLIAGSDIQLCKSVGTGEFATVYEARWRVRDGEELAVAVKVLLRERLQTDACAFLKEAQLALQLTHAHVVRLFGIVVEGDSLMLVAELAALKSLLECVRDPLLSRQFALPRLARFATQIADAMKYLEQRRLVHRDLAARNVLVFSLDTVKVSDFGMSRALALSREYYRTQFSMNLKLPIAWCAPECINYLKFTSASDVWAFGVTLWEVFSYGEQPWRGLEAVEILNAISEPRSERLRRPVYCPTTFYRLLRDCWQHRPEHRPSFSRIHTLLNSAEYRIEQLPALADSDERSVGSRRTSTSDERLLQYARGDLVCVVDRAPSDTPVRGFWFGVLASNPKVTGFFDPRHFMASTSTSASAAVVDGLISTAGRSVLALVRRSLRKEESPQPKRGLSRDMISAPQNDVRHVGHLGSDGSAFGDMRVLGIAEHVPPAAVLQIANADATLRRHSISRAHSMARQISSAGDSRSPLIMQAAAAKRGVQRQRSNAADSVASFAASTFTSATDDTLTQVTTSALFASHYDEISERSNDYTPASMEEAGGQVNRAVAMSTADSISAIVNVNGNGNVNESGTGTGNGNGNAAGRAPVNGDQLDGFDLNLNLLDEVFEALNLSDGPQSPNSNSISNSEVKPMAAELGSGSLAQSWPAVPFTGAGKRNKLRLKLELEPNTMESSYPAALNQPLLVAASDGTSMRALSPADEKKLDNAIALAKECAAKSNASLNDRDRIASPPLATNNLRDRMMSPIEREQSAAVANVSCSPNTSSVMTVSTVKSSDSDRDERDRESGGSSPTRKKAPFRISFHRRSSASPRGNSSPKSAGTPVPTTGSTAITNSSLNTAVTNALTRPQFSYTDEMEARHQRSFALSPSDVAAYNELVNKVSSPPGVASRSDDVDLRKVRTSAGPTHSLAASASEQSTVPKRTDADADADADALDADERQSQMPFESVGVRVQRMNREANERASFSSAGKSAFLASTSSPKVLGRAQAIVSNGFSTLAASNKTAGMNSSGYATLFSADAGASPLRLVRESGPFTSSMRVPPRRSSGVSMPTGALLPNRNALASGDSGSSSSGLSANVNANPLPVPPRSRLAQSKPLSERNPLVNPERVDSPVRRNGIGNGNGSGNGNGVFLRDVLRATVTGTAVDDSRRNSMPLEPPPAPPHAPASTESNPSSQQQQAPFSIESFRDMVGPPRPPRTDAAALNSSNGNGNGFSSSTNSNSSSNGATHRLHETSNTPTPDSSQRSSTTLTPRDDIQLDASFLVNDVSYEDLFELSQSQSRRCEFSDRTALSNEAALKNKPSQNQSQNQNQNQTRTGSVATSQQLGQSATRSSLRVSFSALQRQNALQPDDVRLRRQTHTRTASCATEMDREPRTGASFQSAQARASGNTNAIRPDTVPIEARLLLQLYQLGLTNDVQKCKRALVAADWNLAEAVKLLVRPNPSASGSPHSNSTANANASSGTSATGNSNNSGNSGATAS